MSLWWQSGHVNAGQREYGSELRCDSDSLHTDYISPSAWLTHLICRGDSSLYKQLNKAHVIRWMNRHARACVACIEQPIPTTKQWPSYLKEHIVKAEGMLKNWFRIKTQKQGVDKCWESDRLAGTWTQQSWLTDDQSFSLRTSLFSLPGTSDQNNGYINRT